MSDRKGLLSEQLSGSVAQLRRVSFGREKNHAEIKQIFSQGSPTMGRSTIFGCSPPVRASNPVPSDSKFLNNSSFNTISSPSLESTMKST
mmetsp:Transcript_8763/g.24998  ORF Transcript_8763/g.24998 Transcript_8763/m.24998 type:complete len:90 (+) Transcript_8763:231-500(+)